MALVECHECGKKISTEAPSCPSCGAQAPTDLQRTIAKAQRDDREATRKKKIGTFAAVGALAAIAIVAIAPPSSPGAMSERDRKRMAIDLCWKEHERAKLTMAEPEQRFIASTCVRMQDEYNAAGR